MSVSQSVSQLVRHEQNCTLVASRRTPSTGALESFCEFFSCMQLEYCLRDPLSKFEALRRLNDDTDDEEIIIISSLVIP